MVSKIYFFPTTTYYPHDSIAKPSNSLDKILSSHNSDIPQKLSQMCSYVIENTFGDRDHLAVTPSF